MTRIVIVIIILVNASCSNKFSIQKRKYRSGFYFAKTVPINKQPQFRGIKTPDAQNDLVKNEPRTIDGNTEPEDVGIVTTEVKKFPNTQKVSAGNLKTLTRAHLKEIKLTAKRQVSWDKKRSEFFGTIGKIAFVLVMVFVLLLAIGLIIGSGTVTATDIGILALIIGVLVIFTLVKR